MTLLVTGKSFPNWGHLPESQFCADTAARSSHIELCGVPQVTAGVGVCLHLILPEISLSFFGGQVEASVHKREIPRERSGAVPQCLPHSLEKLPLLTPCAQIIVSPTDTRAIESSLEAFGTPQYPLTIPLQGCTVNNVWYHSSHPSYIPRPIISYRRRKPFLTHNEPLFHSNSFPHCHFCDTVPCLHLSVYVPTAVVSFCIKTD